MNKAAVLNPQDLRYKERASQSLAEAHRILRELAAERRRSSRRRVAQTSLVKEVKAILKGG